MNQDIKKILEDSEKGIKADLRNADLHGANLLGADLKGANLRGADLRGADGIIQIQSQYKYQCYGYFRNKEMRVRLGCFDRTVREWDNDFWNNHEEFPKDSPQGQNRFMVYSFIKEYLIKNYKED